MIKVAHRQLINPTLKPHRNFLCVRFKDTTTILRKAIVQKGIRRIFPFFVSKTAFDADREQETATAMDNQNLNLIGSSVTLLVLSTVFVVLRLLSRKLSKAGFWVSMRFDKSKISS